MLVLLAAFSEWTSGSPVDAAQGSGPSVYVADAGSNAISVIDAATGILGATIAMSSPPHAIAVAPGGKMAYVTTDAGVVPLDLTTNGPGQTIPVAGPLYGIAITPDALPPT